MWSDTVHYPLDCVVNHVTIHTVPAVHHQVLYLLIIQHLQKTSRIPLTCLQGIWNKAAELLAMEGAIPGCDALADVLIPRLMKESTIKGYFINHSLRASSNN